MKIPMVDTFCITVDIKNYGFVDLEKKDKFDIFVYLGQQKDEAKLRTAENMNYKHIVELGGQFFQLLQNGSKGYSYILHNDSYELKISQHRSKNENLYPVFVRIKQECLWLKGINESWNIINDWIQDNIGEIKETKVSRIDVCCHTDEISINNDDIETFEGKYHTDTIYRFKRSISDMVFGSRTTGKIMCRIYNKTLEVMQKRQKLWFFDIWNKNGLNPDKVWNVEYEITRDFLKEVKLNTVDDVFNNLKSIWQYCTEMWLIKKDLDRTRIERCSISKEWQSIQRAFDSFTGTSLIEREKQQEASAFALIPGTIGNITSYAARAGINDIDDVFEIIKSQGQKYLKNKELTYDDVIDKKMSLMPN